MTSFRILGPVALLPLAASLCLLHDRGAGSGLAPGTTGPTRLDVEAVDGGYTLFAPNRSTTTYLIDRDGQVAHQWKSEQHPGQSVYLLENGNLLRTAKVEDNPVFGGGGAGGRVQEIAWDGSVVWDYVYSSEEHLHHHDVERLPNGNVLLIAWERKTADEAIAAGRDPQLLDSAEFWPDHLIEVEPLRPSGGRIVWEWHVWDHLIQDFDSSKDNYGDVAAHPELVDINADSVREEMSDEDQRRQLEALRALGYVGELPDEDAPARHIGRGGPDWIHTNSVAYHAGLDQIVLSIHSLSEIWVIDHGTTSEEAAGHSGGRSGKGGDLLYRWGNPQNYRRGTESDRQLYAQHDAHWITEGLPGAGHILIFNNGTTAGARAWSSVDEIVPPVDDEGDYALLESGVFGPGRPAWTCSSTDGVDFYSGHISGAQRLPSGNTLICAGESGRFIEVTPSGEAVWEYSNPFEEAGGPGGRDERGPGPGRGPREGARRGPPPGHRGPPPPPGGRGARPGGPPHGASGGPPQGGPPHGGRSVFRAYRYASDYAGLAALRPAESGKDGVPE